METTKIKTIFSYLCLLFVHFTSGVAEVSWETKIGDFARAVVVDEDISGRQISMNDLERLKKNISD